MLILAVEKNSYINFLTKTKSKRGVKTLLSKRTVMSIYSRTLRIENIIGKDLDNVLEGKKNNVEELLLKFNSRLESLNHLDTYKSALKHYNNYISSKK